ncbi:MAG: hypothetical protein IJL98_03640 [Lachnospiraceae bacterium]|nr:hypothetical protein [Lachnospiraceae bacterium]
MMQIGLREESFGKKTYLKGSVSIFLALLMIPVLMLAMTLLESVRAEGLRLVVRQCGHTAMDNVRAGFDRTVLEQYGLLFFDGGYGQGLTQYDRLEEEFRDWFLRNASGTTEHRESGLFSVSEADAELSEAVFATDYQGRMFVTSALDFYKYDKPAELLEGILQDIHVLEEGEDLREASEEKGELPEMPKESEDSEDSGKSEINGDQETVRQPEKIGGSSSAGTSVTEEERREGSVKGSGLERSEETEKSSRMEKGKGPDRSERSESSERSERNESPESNAGSETGEDSSENGSYNDLLSSGLIGQSREVKAKGWSALAMPEDRSLSGFQINTENLPSKVSVDVEAAAETDFFSDLLKKAVFNEYLLDHFSCFTDTEERPGLQYELEYILFGKDQDNVNLKKVMNRILVLREGINLGTLMSSEKMTKEAEALAVMVSGWTGIKEVMDAVQILIEGAWAHAESIADMKLLLSGKKIPLLKKEEEWSISLENAAAFLAGTAVVSLKEDAEEGMDYRDYLRLLLYMGRFQDVSYRAMDMVQHNQQKNGRVYFMTAQIYAMEFRLKARAKPLFTALPFMRRDYFSDAEYEFQGYFSGSY